MRNLLIIEIILPLFFSLLLVFVPRRFAHLTSLTAVGLTLVISIILFKYSLSTEAIFYNLGGWPSSLGIEYKLDKLNSFFMLLVSLMNLFNLIAMKDLLNSELDNKKLTLFFSLYLIAFSGLLGVCISNDIFNIYVLLEINSIASYALVGAANKKSSPRAAFDYLIFGTIGSTMFLFGIGFIYVLIGSLNLGDISESIVLFHQNNAAIAGIILIFIGILMKSALFPLSRPLINIYQGAPSFVSSILAATSNKIGIYLLLRFFFDIFHVNSYPYEYQNILLIILGITAIIFCAILALRQENFKRFLGYSSLSQIGLIVFACALASKAAVVGVIIYCFSHALEKTVLFLASGCLFIKYKSENFYDFKNIFQQNKLLSLLILINLFSTVGIPLTAGFIGKWQIFKAALAGDIIFIFAVLVASLFTIAYVFKFIEIMIFSKQSSDQIIIKDPDSSIRICLFIMSILTIINLYIGFNSKFIIGIAEKISVMVIQ